MNEVKIRVDDKTKTLRFGERLTSGSRYRVVVDGGADVCGAAGSLVLVDRGELVAFAELTDGEGELSTNTQEMAKAMKGMSIGVTVEFDVVLHKKDDAEGENVAVGICRVLSSGGAWTDGATGALTLYKGEKGDAGAAGADGKDGADGTDGKDGVDGKSAYEIAVEKGFEGTEEEWLKSLVGLPGALSEVQLVDADGNKTDEFYEVLCKEVDGEKVLVLEQTKIDGVAAKSNAKRAEIAAKAAATSEANAATSATNAATSEANSATSEANAATSATNAAASEANAATSEANAATSEANAATSEANAATSEANAATEAGKAETAYENVQALLSSGHGVLWMIHEEALGGAGVTKTVTIDVSKPCLDIGASEGAYEVVALFHCGNTNQVVTFGYTNDFGKEKSIELTGHFGLRCAWMTMNAEVKIAEETGAAEDGATLSFTVTRSTTAYPTICTFIVFKAAES